MSARCPRRRTDGLVRRRIDDETIVYDTVHDRISQLDPLATTVWEAIDGERSVSQLACRIGSTDDEVEGVLAHLTDAGLLAESGLDRRTLLTRLAAAATAASVMSIAAPSVAAAASPTGPVVGGFRHTCRGAHTSTFTVVISGFPPSSPVRLFSSWSDVRKAISPADPTINDTVTDTAGVATFTWSFVDTGRPIRSRTVTLASYQLGGGVDPVPISGQYTGTCP